MASISPGSAATYFRCGGIFDDDNVITTTVEFDSTTNMKMLQSYGQDYTTTFYIQTGQFTFILATLCNNTWQFLNGIVTSVPTHQNITQQSICKTASNSHLQTVHYLH